jgi:hypothetical protein
MPNVTPLEFEKTTVPLVAVCVPATTATMFCVCTDCEAPIEIVDPFVEIDTIPVALSDDTGGADTWIELFE